MPFFLIVIGIILLVTAIQGTIGKLGTMLGEDFFGGGASGQTLASGSNKGGFVYWFVSILIIGGIGYAAPLRGFSRAVIALLILVLVLSNGGLFAKFNQALAAIKPSQGGGTSGPLGVPSSNPATQTLFGPGTLFPTPDSSTPSYIPGVM